MSTTITPLAGGYLEVTCLNPLADALKRHYVIRRTVDYGAIAWC